MKINILSDNKLFSKLESLKEQGFDQIKLPGGTSKDRQHFSAVVICYYNPNDKKTYFLGLPYNSSFHKSGDENENIKKHGETPTQTAIREAKEETELILKKEDLEELVYAKYEVKDRDDRSKVVHVKHFFLVKKFSGNISEFDGPNETDGEIAAPLWISAVLFKKVLWGGHRKAFDGSLRILSSDREICMSIMDLL